MNHRLWRRVCPLLIAASVLLAACSSPQPSAPVSVKPEAPTRDLVAEVRAAGEESADSLEVQPLRDGAVADLRATAAQHEAAQEYAQADAVLRQALRITPDDPGLLQLRAEIALGSGDLDLAEQLANQSYERGPKIGGLCRRNWATVRLARETRGDDGGALVAATQARNCTVEPPVRM